MNDHNIPRSGFIVFSKDLKKIVLVQNYKLNYSFPKGKRKYGEFALKTALRELKEETGLKLNDIEIINELFFDEITKNGDIYARYFIAFMKNNRRIFKYNINEIRTVNLYPFNVALLLEKFKKRRKKILIDVLKLIIH